MFPTRLPPWKLAVAFAIGFGAWAEAGTPVGNFTIDPAQREASRLFYRDVYLASDGVPIGFTGDVASGDPGTTSQEFRDAVLRRINYFRAMAGVPTNVVFTTTFNTKCQQAALMMSANNALNHSPPMTWIHYTAGGAEAAFRSNLFLGSFGPRAVTGFMEDFGPGNTEAGHRRWFLYPQTREMGTGDIPGTSRAANAIWVVDPTYFGTARPTVRNGFVAWPPPGFVPYQVVFPRWSLSHSNLIFSNATVTVTRNGANIPVTIDSTETGSGENSIVWREDGVSAANPSKPRKPAADTTTQITVGNVLPLVAGQPQSFTYSVTVFDPAVPGPDSLVLNAAGAYAAYIPGTTFETTGVIGLAVSSRGKFTGVLILGGKRFNFRGTFDDYGMTPMILLSRGAGQTPLQLTLQVPTGTLPPTQITGQVTDGAGFTANINAAHSLYTAKRNPAAPLINVAPDLLGPFTVALDITGAAGVTGHGFATATLAKSGVIRFAGTLPDGAKWSSQAPLSAGGTAPIFAQLYRKKGSLYGTVTLGGVAPRTLTGVLGWRRPNGVDTGPFSAGWPAGVLVNLHGGAWIPPAKGVPWQPPGFTAATGNATLTASGGALGAPLPWNANYAAATKRFTVEPAGGLNAKLSVKPASGLCSGSFQPSAGARMQKFSGVLLLGENRGLGFFLDTAGSGKAAVTPR